MKSIQTTSYKINFGDFAYNELSTYIQNSKFSSIIIIVDSNTVDLCLPILVEKLGHKICSRVIKFDFGEVNKNIRTCCDIWNSMASYGVDRNSLIINLGGGVVTDLGGFVSSTYKRGIKFVNIPTTLLAMVDASIGGKTGINFSEAKNQVGTIAFAEMIIIDTDYLKSLASKEFNSGSAEMFKHGLISDKIYWEVLQKTKLNIDNDLEELIHKSIQIKNSIVALDPEEKNIRKSLNFGHTLGHAIESYSLKNNKLKPLLHGEAIAIGMVLEAYLANKVSGLSDKELEEIKEVFKSKFDLIEFDKEQINSINKLLIHDKKNSHGNINFTLLKTIGKYVIDQKADEELIIKAFNYYLK
jgi:3-dehydroquinate synthase